jgi:glutamate-1-semialdehyde aminotransferase
MFDKAKALIPGGVNSPARAFASVGGTPPFIARGKGSSIWDIDSNRYIDYVCSWSPLILARACRLAVEAVAAAAEKGTFFSRSSTGCLRGGHFTPDQFEAAFVGLAHTDEHIAITVEAAAEALSAADIESPQGVGR